MCFIGGGDDDDDDDSYSRSNVFNMLYKNLEKKEHNEKKSHIDERFERHRYIMLKNSNERTRIYVEQEKKKR